MNFFVSFKLLLNPAIAIAFNMLVLPAVSTILLYALLCPANSINPKTFYVIVKDTVGRDIMKTSSVQV